MVVKSGKFGKFLACPSYPDCRSTTSMPTDEAPKLAGKCPDCGAATTARKSKRGKTYYSCSCYPQCKFMSWDIPVGYRCEICGDVMIKTAEGVGCANKDCKNYLPPKRQTTKSKKTVTKLEEGELAPPPLMDEPIYFGYED